MSIRLVTIAGVASWIFASTPSAAEEGPAPAPAAKTATTAAAPSKTAPSTTSAKTSTPLKGKPKEPEPEPLPLPEVRLWLIAPSTNGSWTLRIDNEGTKPVRIPADVRLLELEVEPPMADPKKKTKPKPVRCAVPDALRPTAFPESRALYLAPGESYIESFDPRLFCFGKNASLLAGASVVRSRFGWKPPAKPPKKGPVGPFAVEGTEDPPSFAPLHQLSAPTILLSYATAPVQTGSAETKAPETEGATKTSAETKAPETEGATKTSDAGGAAKATDAGSTAKTADESKGTAASNSNGDGSNSGPEPKDSGDTGSKDKDAEAQPPKIVDANAPRLEVSASPYADASARRAVSVTVTAKNAGRRPMLALLRSRMISFRVEGPDGKVVCDADSSSRGVPRDMLRTYKPGDAASFTVLLGEVCPREAFARPGLYRVTPTVYAEETGSDPMLSTYTGVVKAKDPTLVRVHTGPEPFYARPPKALPTPRPTTAGEGEGEREGGDEGERENKDARAE